MQNSCHCCHHGHGHLPLALVGGILRRRNHCGNRPKLHHLMSQQSPWAKVKEHKLRATWYCDTKSESVELFLDGVHRNTLSCALFQRCRSHRHILAHRAHFSTSTVQGRIEKSVHEAIRRWLALLECDGYHVHFHELTPLWQVSLTFISARQLPLLAVWRYTKQTQDQEGKGRVKRESNPS